MASIRIPASGYQSFGWPQTSMNLMFMYIHKHKRTAHIFLKMHCQEAHRTPPQKGHPKTSEDFLSPGENADLLKQKFGRNYSMFRSALSPELVSPTAPLTTAIGWPMGTSNYLCPKPNSSFLSPFSCQHHHFLLLGAPSLSKTTSIQHLSQKPPRSHFRVPFLGSWTTSQSPCLPLKPFAKGNPPSLLLSLWPSCFSPNYLKSLSLWAPLTHPPLGKRSFWNAPLLQSYQGHLPGPLQEEVPAIWHCHSYHSHLSISSPKDTLVSLYC